MFYDEKRPRQCERQRKWRRGGENTRLNISKGCVMSFSRRQTLVRYFVRRVNNILIASAGESVHNPGTTLARTLCLNKHIREVRFKSSKVLEFVRRVSRDFRLVVINCLAPSRNTRSHISVLIPFTLSNSSPIRFANLETLFYAVNSFVPSV